MVDPYRTEIAPRGVVELVEDEPAPSRSLRARRWSDGTTVVRIGSQRPLVERGSWWAGAVTFAVAATLAPFVACGPGRLGGGACLIMAGLLAWRGVRASFGERVVVTPAALLRRRWLRRTSVFALADVSTVLVAGSAEEAHLEVQVGRERVPLAEELGYDEATLRWIAQRLRRAVEDAR